MRSLVVSLPVLWLLSGCVLTAQPITELQLTHALDVQQQQFNEQWQQQQQAQQLHEQQQHEQQQQQAQYILALTEQLAALTRHQRQTQQLLRQQQAPQTTQECVPVVALKNSDKMIFGQVEQVTVPLFERQFDARVDTGAATTSMAALNKVFFERDGKTWVQFDLPSDGDKPTRYEVQVERFVQIKKAGSDDTDRRPVVRLRLKIGNFDGITDVNLTDRSHMEFQLLLGRKFFKDIAIVDVSQQYIQSH